MSAGRLTVVGTPIGNLEDLSARAVAALSSADLVACEDTRRTGRLLQAAGVARRELVVVNEHTEADVAPHLVERARAGATVALVSDAGMPAVSDPGERVVAAFVAAGIPVSVVPGPSAVSTVVAGSGLPSGRFVFEGFLPRKGSARAARLEEIAAETRSVVLYEAPHRIERTVADLLEWCGPDRPVALVREATKLHEEWFRGDLAGAATFVVGGVRGEIALVLGGAAPAGPVDDDALRDALRAARAAGASTRDAVSEVVERFGVSKRRVYDLAHGP